MALDHEGMKFVPQQLRDKAALYEQRNKLYGDNYKRFGPVMALLFPKGLTLTTPDDFNRIGVFVQIVGKLTRYAEQFTSGGHEDSLDDTAVYSMMMKELDLEAKEQPKDSMALLPADVANWLSGLSDDQLRALMDSTRAVMTSPMGGLTASNFLHDEGSGQ